MFLLFHFPAAFEQGLRTKHNHHAAKVEQLLNFGFHNVVLYVSQYLISNLNLKETKIKTLCTIGTYFCMDVPINPLFGIPINLNPYTKTLHSDGRKELVP